MVDSARLKALLGLVLVVLLAHLALLRWLAPERHSASQLRPLTLPMVTRQLPANTSAPSPRGAQAIPASTHSESDTHRPPIDQRPAPLAQAVAKAAPTQGQTSAADHHTTTTFSVAADEVGDWPADTLLHYHLTGRYKDNLQGDAQLHWQRDQNRYQLEIQVTIGWLNTTLQSQGHLSATGPEPDIYHQNLVNTPGEVQLRSQDILLGDGTSVTRPLGVQDMASQFVALPHLLNAAADSLKAGDTFSLWLVYPGGVDFWTYDVIGSEVLTSSAFGDVPAWHIKPRQQLQARGALSSEMWLAPSLQYLPLRFRLSLNNDEYVDLELDKMEQSESTKQP